jgi:hypothetical protein
MTGTEVWQYGPLAPVTWYLGFIRAPAQNIADALVKQGRNTGKSVSTVELDGGLADAVAALAPFTHRYYARKVIISTESEWCLIVNNSAIGFDPRPVVSHLAVELGVLSALVHCAPYESSWSGKKTSRNQATSLERPTMALHPGRRAPRIRRAGSLRGCECAIAVHRGTRTILLGCWCPLLRYGILRLWVVGGIVTAGQPGAGSAASGLVRGLVSFFRIATVLALQPLPRPC